MRGAALALVALLALPAAAEQPPRWAFPLADPVQPAPPDMAAPRSIPGSALAYSLREIDDLFRPPIWFPEQRPARPRVVAEGARPAVRACASCHLQNGMGHPESSHVAGLPVAYLRRQMLAFRNGERHDPIWMSALSRALTDEDLEASVQWAASLPPAPWVRVVETDTIPRSMHNRARMRIPSPEGGTEPLGNRIAEFPENTERAINRDPNSGFVAYVPPGSIARGRALAEGRGGLGVACADCHGATLSGLDEVPRIAGISPLYTVRQLWGFKTENRTGEAAMPMRAVMAGLDGEAITALAAYLASLPP